MLDVEVSEYVGASAYECVGGEAMELSSDAAEVDAGCFAVDAGDGDYFDCSAVVYD